MVLNTYKYLPDDDGHDEVVAGQGVAQLHAAVDIESVAGPEPALHPESQVKGWVLFYRVDGVYVAQETERN